MVQVPVLAIHGGAGTINREALSAEAEREYRGALQSILEKGRDALAAGASDILHDMKWTAPEQGLPLFSPSSLSAAAPPLPPTAEEKEILHAVRMGFNTIDTLCASLGKPACAITPLLSRMQIAGQITPDAGGYFSINHKGH